MTSFAEIAIDSYQDPAKKLFTYKISGDLLAQAKLGAKVIAPFGRRTVEGYIWKLTNSTPPFPTKEIREMKQGFTEAQVKLASWMSDYYLASPLDCLKCQIPGKGERVAIGNLEEISTLLLIPYASQVRLRATILNKLHPKGVMVGSRSAVFAQLPNLKKIIIEEPENWSYKDERSPYYHVKEVAKKRAEVGGLELKLSYQVPRVEEFYFEKLEVPKSKPVKILDLNQEKAAGNFTFVSQPLEAQINAGKNTIVYVNSKGLREKMNEELRKMGADKNRVEIYGPELFALAGKKAEAIFWTDVDTIFNLPDFRAHEKIVWTTQKLGGLAQGDLYLQTSSPNHPLFQELGENGNLTNFYERELKVRQELGFPPFSTLVKLSFSGKSSAKVNFEAEKLYEELSGVKSQESGVEISPPYQPYHARGGTRFSSGARGSYSATPEKFQLNIAVRMKKSANADKLFAAIPPDWRIEVDPESFL